MTYMKDTEWYKYPLEANHRSEENENEPNEDRYTQSA